MSILFEIHYNPNPNGMFFSGQVVSGRALIHLKKDISIKGVTLRVQGYARVKWKERVKIYDNNDLDYDTRTKVNSNQEQYIDAFTNCVDTKGGRKKLDAGTHVYNFAIPLPLGIPSSFEGKYGHIRYDSTITVERNLLPNKSYSMGFFVLQSLNLNHLPVLKNPVNTEISKKFVSWLCKSKPLLLNVVLPKTGFIPEEMLQVYVKVLNHSNIVVKQVQISLNRIDFYSIKGNKKTDKNAIALKKLGPFGDAMFEFKDFIKVPRTSSTGENICRMIRTAYIFEVTARFNGGHKPLIVSIPIAIGSIPLKI